MKPYYQDSATTIYLGDCREILPQLARVDLVLTDPPYGVTDCEWDEAWCGNQFWQLLGPAADGFVIHSQQPFTTKLITGNSKQFRHTWIWNKVLPSGFHLSRFRPMMLHEEICIFGKVIFTPQKTPREDVKRCSIATPSDSNPLASYDGIARTYTDRLPVSILEFSNANQQGKEHPTQKPVELAGYLLRTYSESKNTILDPFMGSGTTLRAAKDLGRKAIGIEIEERYCEIAANRLAQEVLQLEATT